jgi:hypothetical protein
MCEGGLSPSNHWFQASEHKLAMSGEDTQDILIKFKDCLMVSSALDTSNKDLS